MVAVKAKTAKNRHFGILLNILAEFCPDWDCENCEIYFWCKSNLVSSHLNSPKHVSKNVAEKLLVAVPQAGQALVYDALCSASTTTIGLQIVRSCNFNLFFVEPFNDDELLRSDYDTLVLKFQAFVELKESCSLKGFVSQKELLKCSLV